MAGMMDLLADLMNGTDLWHEASESVYEGRAAHECDCCGEAKDDVDLWATDTETGEELWLCLACGEW